MSTTVRPDTAIGAPAVSVIVACTRPERIAGLAQALAVGAGDVACELLVAGDVSALDAQGWPVPTTLIACAVRHPNHRRQLALERAVAPVVAFLDDDAVPLPGWLAAAAELPPHGHEVWTGPEEAPRRSAGAQLARAVAATPLAEGTRAHVATEPGDLQWFEVPFCNLVTTRALLDELGPLRADQAWDIDDFVMCRAAAGRGARFRNRPALAIAHDRYPDRPADWLRKKAAERRRTGQKLIRYPGIYGRLPGAVAAAALPWAGIAVLAALGSRRGRVLRAAGVAYLVAVAAEGLRTGQRGRALGRFAAGVSALHVVSVSAMQLGIVEGVVGRAAGRPDPLDPAAEPSEGELWPRPC